MSNGVVPQADIQFPEAPGIIQVENFGMHISEEGFMLYGMYIEAIGERKAHDISLDMLSRLLVDVRASPCGGRRGVVLRTQCL